MQVRDEQCFSIGKIPVIGSQSYVILGEAQFSKSAARHSTVMVCKLLSITIVTLTISYGKVMLPTTRLLRICVNNLSSLFNITVTTIMITRIVTRMMHEKCPSAASSHAKFVVHVHVSVLCTVHVTPVLMFLK